jgi:hypothetical protein
MYKSGETCRFLVRAALRTSGVSPRDHEILIAETGFRAQPNSDRPVKVGRPAQGGFCVTPFTPMLDSGPASRGNVFRCTQKISPYRNDSSGNWAQLSTVTGEGSILVYETLNHERVRSIEYRLAVRSMPSRPFDWRSVVEETIVIERRLILKKKSNPASSCVGAAPGSCAPAKAGGTGHSHRASQLGTSGRNRCLTIPS